MARGTQAGHLPNNIFGVLHRPNLSEKRSALSTKQQFKVGAGHDLDAINHWVNGESAAPQQGRNFCTVLFTVVHLLALALTEC